MDILEKMKLRRQVLQDKRDKRDEEKITRLIKRWRETKQPGLLLALQRLGVEVDWEPRDDEWAWPGAQNEVGSGYEWINSNEK